MEREKDEDDSGRINDGYEQPAFILNAGNHKRPSPPHNIGGPEKQTQPSSSYWREPMVWFTAVIALTGILQFSVIKGQLETMDAQLLEIKSSGKQTDKLITQTEILARAAKSQAESSKAFAIAATSQVDRLKELAISAQGSMAAAKKSFALQSELFMIEQRPYLWIKKFETGDITNDRPTLINITFVNGGKGTARNIDSTERHFIVAENEKAALMFGMGRPEPPANPKSGSFLPPGEQMFMTVSGILSMRDVQAIMNDTHQIYVFGSIRYSDAKDVRHKTDWCGIVLPLGHTFGDCKYGNYQN
jgi:hypothetical protein